MYSLKLMAVFLLKLGDQLASIVLKTANLSHLIVNNSHLRAKDANSSVMNDGEYGVDGGFYTLVFIEPLGG